MESSHFDAVVKVGGSLYEWPHLRKRLRSWLVAEWNSGFGVVLVPGGGRTADAVRELDRLHQLGEETSHWLALRALSLNAHFLASLLPFARVIEDVEDVEETWFAGQTPVLDVHAFARADEGRAGCLPASWSVTSDSLAARVALAAKSRCLVLLKSTTIPPSMDWSEAGRLGLVDAMFAEILRAAPRPFYVHAVNLRAWPD
ncbi:MAG TPA: hypothetical protein VH643_08790 [Gemmataceae bacterium]|jgi:aspartokinase-like uncharacterized kinase